MARNRDEQLLIIEALNAPKSIFDILLALNTPDERSPYKKELENKIIEGVNFEEFLEIIEVLLEISRTVSEKMREEVILERLNEKSYEQLQSRLAFQFNADAAKSRANVSRMSIENRIAHLTMLLAVELPKKQAYESRKEELKTEMKNIEKNWTNRQTESAKTFYDSFESKMKNGELDFKVKLEPEHKVRLEKAFQIAPPEKLIKANEAVIKEAGDDEKKVEQVANSMAVKSDFVRNLQVLTETGRIEHENSNKKDEEYFPKPSRIKELNKKLPIESNVKEDKKDIADAIKCDRELKQTEKKLVRNEVLEDKLEAAKKDQITLQKKK